LAVAGALAYAYKHSEPFRKAVDAIGSAFKDHLLPALKDAWRTVLPGIKSAFDSIKQSIQDNQGLFRLIGDAFKLLGKALVDIVIPALAQFYRHYIPLIGKAVALLITAVRLLGDAWLLMAQAGLQAFKVLVTAALASFGAIVDAAAAGLGWLPGIGDKVKGAKKAFDNFRDNTVAALDVALGKVRDLRAELDNLKPKTVRIHFAVDKPPIKMIGDVPIFKPEGAGARGAIINRPTVALVGENGPERLTPLDQTPGNEPLPGGRGGPQFVVEKVYAQDVNDFLTQMQRRARHSSLDGVPR
jgi:hypothetical protein